jgi:hypothetical protein
MGDEGARFQGCDRGGHGLPAAACAAACRTVGERTEGSSASFMERPSAKLVPYAMQHPRNNTRGNQYSPDVNSFGASSSTIVQTGPEDPSTHTTSCLMAGGAIPLASSSVCTCMRVRSGARARGHALDPTRGPVADAPRRTSHPRGASSTAKVSAGGSVARTTSPAASATPCAGMMGCACPMLLTGLFLNFRRFFGARRHKLKTHSASMTRWVAACAARYAACRLWWRRTDAAALSSGAPPPEAAIRMLADSGGGAGRGWFATRRLRAGERILAEAPIVADSLGGLARHVLGSASLRNGLHLPSQFPPQPDQPQGCSPEAWSRAMAQATSNGCAPLVSRCALPPCCSTCVAS